MQAKSFKYFLSRILQGKLLVEVLVSPAFILLAFFSVVSFSVITFACAVELGLFVENLREEIVLGHPASGGSGAGTGGFYVVPSETDQGFLRARCRASIPAESASIFEIRKKMKAQKPRRRIFRLAFHKEPVAGDASPSQAGISGETIVAARIPETGPAEKEPSYGVPSVEKELERTFHLNLNPTLFSD